ncbi:MAG: MFS transporter [Treponema sp.]|jgi:GPH family glycoside/pentoside/hexuronide:cation symporter|nr:MFS transporter [Treponema sp.]
MNRLSVREKLGFGIFDLGGNLFFTALGFWSLNYLTDTAGLAAGLAGFAVMIGKLWDAVSDPVMGYISDRTRSRWGRRRPYLLFGALPVLLAMWAFFTAPNIENPCLLTLWAALMLILLNTANTVINVPYASLTPELTSGYHERTILNGYRFGFAVFGTIIGAAAVKPLVDAFSSPRLGFSMTGLLLGGVVALTSLLCFFGTKEKTRSPGDYPAAGFWATYGAVFSNRPFVLLLGTYALHLMGISFLQGILVYYTKYLYRREDLTAPAMVILLLTAMVCIPLSVLVSKRIGKKRTYQICFALLAGGCMIIFCLGHLLGTSFFLGMMVWAGAGVGFSYVAPFAMVPDAVEYDALNTGERKEGAFYGMWTFTAKLGQSLAVFLSGLILAGGGYAAGAVQGAGALMAIRLIIGPLPALIFLLALVLVQFYPLDEGTYKKLTASA